LRRAVMYVATPVWKLTKSIGLKNVHYLG
jgi:hypothetical protein